MFFIDLFRIYYYLMDLITRLIRGVKMRKVITLGLFALIATMATSCGACEAYQKKKEDKKEKPSKARSEKKYERRSFKSRLAR